MGKNGPCVVIGTIKCSTLMYMGNITQSGAKKGKDSLYSCSSMHRSMRQSIDVYVDLRIKKAQSKGNRDRKTENILPNHEETIGKRREKERNTSSLSFLSVELTHLNLLVIPRNPLQWDG